MYEFVVPEPAAFYLHAQKNKTIKGVTLKEPPGLGNLKPSDLDVGTYEFWVKRYNVKNVAPPPPKVSLIGTAVELQEQGKPKESTKISKELKVPKGYKATFAWAIPSRTEWSKYDDDKQYPHLAIIVGRFKLVSNSATPTGWGKIGDYMGIKRLY